MAFDFPASPTNGQTYTPAGGPTYVYSTASGAWLVSPVSGDYVAKAGDTMTGDLAIAKASPSLVLNKAASGQASIIDSLMNGLRRWRLNLGNTTAEAGANAGSDFSIVAYDDAGSNVATAFRITRSTGVVDLPVGATTLTPAAGDNSTKVATTAFVAAANTIVTTVLTSSGTWTKPAGLRYLEVTLQGPGGSGGSVTGATSQLALGSGGGAGGCAKSRYDAASLAASIAYTHGAPGVGPAAGSNGVAGGTSTFGAMTATGGAGGTFTAAGAGGTTNILGAPGVGSGGNIDNLKGQQGVAYVAQSATWGTAGPGGMSPVGGGGGDVAMNNAVGGNGSRGGGGGGAALVNSTGSRKGGDGGHGCLILTEIF